MRKIPSQATKTKKNLLQNLPDPNEKYNSKKIVFSYLDYDISQGQSPENWQKIGLLSKKIERIKHFSGINRKDAINDKMFNVYGGFPRICKVFKHPAHVTKDANWCAMRVMKQERVIGHLIDNIFYVVFLDKDHDFYPMDIKNNKN